MRLNSTIRTNDGTNIWISSYSPEISNEKVIIIAPGLGLTQDDYDPFANFFCQEGFAVVTFDYRGVGGSAPKNLSGYQANMHQWAVQDINAVILYVKSHYLKHELIYIGHAIGGEIFGLAPASQYIDRIILISCALSCARFWSWPNKITIGGFKLVVKFLSGLFGYFPGKQLNIFGNLPQGVVHEWVNWCDNSNGLFDNFPDNNYRKLNVPLLAYTFADDWRCPPRAVKELLDRFENSTITWYHIKPKELGERKIGSHNFFYNSSKKILWQSLVRWINKNEKKLAEEKGITLKRYIS